MRRPSSKKGKSAPSPARKNDTRVSMRVMWKMEWRARCMYGKRCPALFWSSLLSALFQALAPYAAIWFSAQILGKPTAVLDPIAEAKIYAHFDEITDDRTAIYISHRLSSCQFCDEIAVFDGRTVVRQGTHEALLAQQDGLYTVLWNAQAQYYT